MDPRDAAVIPVGISQENTRKMREELRPLLKGYRQRFISKWNINFMLMENPPEWVRGMSSNYRGRLITTAMLTLGWESYTGSRRKKVRTFVRK